MIDRKQQHAELLKNLRDQGQKVFNNAATVLLSVHEGTIFHPCSQTLTDLGVLYSDVMKTMNSIHVQAAQRIVSSRRCLERRFADDHGRGGWNVGGGRGLQHSKNLFYSL